MAHTGPTSSASTQPQSTFLVPTPVTTRSGMALPANLPQVNDLATMRASMAQRSLTPHQLQPFQQQQQQLLQLQQLQQLQQMQQMQQIMQQPTSMTSLQAQASTNPQVAAFLHHQQQAQLNSLLFGSLLQGSAPHPYLPQSLPTVASVSQGIVQSPIPGTMLGGWPASHMTEQLLAASQPLPSQQAVASPASSLLHEQDTAGTSDSGKPTEKSRKYRQKQRKRDEQLYATAFRLHTECQHLYFQIVQSAQAQQNQALLDQLEEAIAELVPTPADPFRLKYRRSAYTDEMFEAELAIEGVVLEGKARLKEKARRNSKFYRKEKTREREGVEQQHAALVSAKTRLTALASVLQPCTTTANTPAPTTTTSSPPLPRVAGGLATVVSAISAASDTTLP
eukprot:m.92156 g.92156  ORF g.92156 m.92156 type:complete len:394 (-) comp12977_c3_seq2:238-1419(-)